MATSRKPSPNTTRLPAARAGNRETDRVPPAPLTPVATLTRRPTERPGRATQNLLQVLAEDVEDLRAQLKALREEMAIVRTVVAAQGKASGGYRRVNED